MSGIDYSKWDKMDFSDDESASSDNAPRVTRLNEPSRVTYSSDGVNVESSTHATVSHTTQTKVATKTSISSAEEGNIRIGLMTKNGASFVDPDTKYESFWSQDRSEVVLCILYDQSSIDSCDIRVHVTGAVNYEGRHSAVGGFDGSQNTDGVEGSKGKVVVSAVGRDSPILEGHLAYPTHLSEGEDEVDWEIDVTDPSKKIIRITLLKAVPMQGLTVWWSRPLLHFPEIDVVSGIEDRDMPSSSKSSKNKNQQEQWKDSWDEAHRMFRDKVKQREKESIDDSEDDER